MIQAALLLKKDPEGELEEKGGGVDKSCGHERCWHSTAEQGPNAPATSRANFLSTWLKIFP